MSHFKLPGVVPILATAIASPVLMDPGMYASTGTSACSQHRSYDPSSNTYVGRNGRRISCQ
jgi:hypothetical protein